MTAAIRATAVLLIAASVTLAAQGVREHTRPNVDRSTAVTESQASELTLTLTDAAIRPIQVWVRTAGLIDAARKNVTAFVSPAEAALMTVGQRVRAFSPESRSRMYQARVTRLAPQNERVAVTATFIGPGHENSPRYILEIVTERGEYLSVPNEAIIETGGKHLVYVQQPDSSYAPREISTGVQGELFTQVVAGLNAGERVVTIGSFFIDAEHKLKGGT